VLITVTGPAVDVTVLAGGDACGLPAQPAGSTPKPWAPRSALNWSTWPPAFTRSAGAQPFDYPPIGPGPLPGNACSAPRWGHHRRPDADHHHTLPMPWVGRRRPIRVNICCSRCCCSNAVNGAGLTRGTPGWRVFRPL